MSIPFTPVPYPDTSHPSEFFIFPGESRVRGNDFQHLPLPKNERPIAARATRF
jgi:hypothetical protein